MSMLGCPCGNVIRDNTDYLPFKGHAFTDIEFFPLFEAISKDVAGFIQARLDGREEKWYMDYFKSDSPFTEDDEGLVHTILARYLIHASIQLYQCTNCGRMLVERVDKPNEYDAFTPDEKPHRNVFATVKLKKAE